MDYNAYYASQLETAREFQDFAIDQLATHAGLHVQQYASRRYQLNVGESRTGVEFKYDKKFDSSRRLWIEFAEKAQPRPGPFPASGIMRRDNTWLWVIGDYNMLFVLGKKSLVNLKRMKLYPELPNSFGTSLGFLLPEQEAEEHALYVLTPREQIKIRKRMPKPDLARYLQFCRRNPGGQMF